MKLVIELAAGLAVLLGLPALIFVFREKLLSAIENVYSDLRQQLPVESRTHVFCISTADDEAFSWLEFIDVLINLPFLLMHKIAMPAVFFVIMVAHYFLRWDFYTPVLEWVAIMLRRAETSKSFGVLWGIYWDDPIPLTATNLKAIIAFLYNESLALALFVVFASSVCYFLSLYAILASASLIASMILRHAVFGMPIKANNILLVMGTRLKVTLTPIYLKNVVFYPSYSGWSGSLRRWLRHSDAYANPRVQQAISALLMLLITECKEWGNADKAATREKLLKLLQANEVKVED
jgi:hypothetical protein